MSAELGKLSAAFLTDSGNFASFWATKSGGNDATTRDFFNASTNRKPTTSLGSPVELAGGASERVSV